MNNRMIRRLLNLCFVTACSALVTHAQDQRGDWAMTGADAGQSGWQKDELGLSPDSVPSKFKFLWKIQLGQPVNNAASFSEPVMIGRVINGQGFKDIVFMSSADTLFAVDSELGSLLWKKHYDIARPASGCETSRLPALMEPPVVINFKARRKRPPGTPRPPDPPPAQSNERKLGVAPGGGYFGFKGIYVLTPDGMLHEQIVTTGADFAPPVKFLPAAGSAAYGLNFADKVIYTATGRDCGGIANGLWSINLAAGDYPVQSLATAQIHPLAFTGPVLTPEGDSLIVTGPGTSPADASVHPASVVAIDKEMKVQDWFTPEGGISPYQHVSPITFAFDKKQLILAPGKAGTLALLDAESLGGADHHTPLFETPALFNPADKHSWDGFASWTDTSGTTWVYASISTPITLSDSTLKVTGPSPHGGVIAFKVTQADGKISLQPAWVSPDMINPAPPRIANGILVALAGGDSSTHAVLHVFNAATGAPLYSSKDEIPTYTQFSGVAIGDSHAFFTDHDNQLYSFGIALEH